MARGSSSYDEIAGMYHALWADWYLPAAMPALERLFFSNVERGGRVLDLCCGSGHVTRELVRRGYKVTGIDNSAELIALAQRELPGVDLRVQDATALRLPKAAFDAALSTFDSLNHILSKEALRSAFKGVHRVLRKGGLFVFDMNLDEAYSLDMHQWAVDVKERSVGLVRGKYDPEAKKAFTELIWFVRTGADNVWRQRHSVVEQRCYPLEDILSIAHGAGFPNVEVIAARDAGVRSDLGFGRMFFVATAQA